MSNRAVKYLIEQIRESKTIASEKTVILTECARIRQSFKVNPL